MIIAAVLRFVCECYRRVPAVFVCWFRTGRAVLQSCSGGSGSRSDVVVIFGGTLPQSVHDSLTDILHSLRS